MNLDITEFGLNIVVLSVIACIFTSIAKILWKKALQNVKDQKTYSDRLSELCFLTEIILSFMATAFYSYLILPENPSAVAYITLSLSTVSCAEVLYTTYESIGLKALTKLLLEKLKSIK